MGDSCLVVFLSLFTFSKRQQIKQHYKRLDNSMGDVLFIWTACGVDDAQRIAPEMIQRRKKNVSYGGAFMCSTF